jgi:hypothetical protein
VSKKKNKNPQPKKPETEVLKGHKKVGTKYLPPFLTDLNLETISWDRDMLPELLWLALLSDQRGYHVAVENAIQLSDIMNTVVHESRKGGFNLASDFDEVLQGERDKVMAATDGNLRDSLESCLGLIAKFYPEFPMKWLVSDKWMKETSVGLDGLEQIKNAMRTRRDRTGKPAMECQVLAFVMESKAGKLIVHSGIAHDVNLISEYPESDESRRMAAQVRAALNALLRRRKKPRAWSNYFMRHSFEISACEYRSKGEGFEESRPDGFGAEAPESAVIPLVDKAFELGQQFENTAQTELQNLWNTVRVDLANPTRQDVIIGLLARNLHLACEIAENPGLWVMPISAILVRCMIETQIRLAWPTKRGTDTDFKDYVEYGLGQEKLYIEHLKRLSVEDRPDKQQIIEDIEQREKWVNAQLFTFLLPVDVGGGNKGKDLRVMADEAGILDLHRLAYSPLSSAVHGHWNSIAGLNLTPCLNPLHGLHWLPVLPGRPINLSSVFDAVDCYSACFELVSLSLTGKQAKSEAVQSYLEQVREVFGSPPERNGG